MSSTNRSPGDTPTVGETGLHPAEEYEPDLAESLETVLGSPAGQELLRRLPGFFQHKADAERQSGDRRTLYVLIAAGVLVAVVVGPVTYLVATGKLSEVGAGFLFGTLAGGIFAFLSRFFGTVR